MSVGRWQRLGSVKRARLPSEAVKLNDQLFTPFRETRSDSPFVLASKNSTWRLPSPLAPATNRSVRRTRMTLLALDSVPLRYGSTR